MLFDKLTHFLARTTVMPLNTVGEALGVELAASNEMIQAVGLWGDMYADESPWLFEREYRLQSLNLAAAIAGEIARLATIELKTKMTGSTRAQFLNTPYQQVVSNLRRQVEYGCAKGGILFKPFVTGQTMTVDFVQADCFYPTAFDGSGKITGAVFVDRLKRGKKTHTRLEYHRIEAQEYRITNKAYMSDTAGWDAPTLGRAVPLTDVAEWSGLQPEVGMRGIDQLLAGYFKVPFANTIDTHSPLGVSVYSRAVDLIKAADEQYNRILWEYEASELAIDADEDALKTGGGKTALPSGRERVFRTHGFSGGSQGDFYKVFSPAIRDESLFNGLNNLLRRIEFQCALAYGTLSDPREVEKTAEEVKSSKQRSYSAVSDLQKALQTALDDLIRAMDTLATLYHLTTPGKYETSYNWDDSIIIDADTERMRDKEDVRDGIMHKWEFRVKWYGEDEANAKKMAGEEQTDDEVMGFADATVS